MNRGDFGVWGIELSTADFARALAALGVLAESRRLPAGSDSSDTLQVFYEAVGDIKGRLYWGLDHFSAELLTADKAPPASQLAEAWRSAQLGHYPMEIVRFPGEDPFWIVSLLARHAVASVYVRQEKPSYPATWGWPLQLALLDDPRSQDLGSSLRAALDVPSWGKRLTRFVRPAHHPGTCQLLLLPFDLAEALGRLSVLGHIHCDVLVVLGGTETEPERALAQIAALRASVRTAGVALARVPPPKRGAWLVSLVEHLSHTETLDRALFAAAGNHSIPAPLLVASRRLIEVSRLSDFVRRRGLEFIRSPYRDLSVGDSTVGQLGERLRDHPDDVGYFHESDMASQAAEIFEGVENSIESDKRWMEEAMEEEMEEAAPPQAPGQGALEGFGPPAGSSRPTRGGARRSRGVDAPRDRPDDSAPRAPSDRRESTSEARFIQAQSFAVLPTGEVERRNSFQQGTVHRLLVRIGQADAAWATARKRFPSEELDWRQEKYELTVILSEPRFLAEPLLSTLVLPRWGNSSRAEFFLPIPETAKEVEARIIVAHENRILQTAILSGPVEGEEDSEVEGNPIEVTVEAVIRPDLGDLSRRSNFDSALVLNHDRRGNASLTSLSSQHVSVYSDPSLDDLIKSFNDYLTDVAFNFTDYSDGLEGEASVDLLRDLAQLGSALHDYLVTDVIGDDPLIRSKKFQIVSTRPDANLPLELVYDREAPLDDAPLCPNAVTALQKGECDAACPSGSEEDTVVCPLAFWCMKKVIERHAHDPQLARSLGGADFAIQAEPSGSRRNLKVLSNAILAGSQRVEQSLPGAMKQLLDALSDTVGGKAVEAADWNQWAIDLKPSRSLLILIVHTDLDGHLQRMEIGNKSWLKVIHVKSEHVRPLKDQPPPLVLLLGCETGSPDIPILSLVSQFRRQGAAIVLSAGSKIHVKHAVPVAKALLGLLKNLKADDDASFGEVMTALRRQMLAAGIPMVLCLTAFGDADWRLVQS